MKVCDVRLEVAYGADNARAARERAHDMAVVLEQHAQRHHGVEGVVCYQDAQGGRSGSIFHVSHSVLRPAPAACRFGNL